MPGPVDSGEFLVLRAYASDRQREFLDAIQEAGSFIAAARLLGVNESVVRKSMHRLRREAARRGYSPDHDMTHPVPDGYKVKGVSTLYDQSSGQARMQWVKSDLDRERQLELMREAIEGLCSEITPIAKISAPKSTNDSLMSLYPVGDHHIGMLSWAKETGANYDTARAEKLLIGATDYLVDSAPESSLGVVAFMGDYLHYDSFQSVTPTSRHNLDADTRPQKMVHAGVKTARYAVERIAAKHDRVVVVILPGNHDPYSMTWLQVAMTCMFENNPRITVSDYVGPFHYLTHQKCQFGFHHGDKVKMADLPLLMATDRAEDWGRTKYRYIFTGHVHHDSVKDFNGARVESLRILPPNDAYSFGAGYRTGRDMKRMDYHGAYGEVCRQLITPEMMDAA